MSARGVPWMGVPQSWLWGGGYPILTWLGVGEYLILSWQGVAPS